MDTGVAIALDRVTKRYGDVTAVSGVSLEIPRGSTIALLGPNGAGKTTTISMLLGLDKPDAGRVAICGRPPRAAVAGGRIAAMLQDCGLMDGVTVAELLELTRRMYPRPLPAGQAAELAGLAGVARRRVERLSGGQLQRLKFALVAVANPAIMLLDEPTRAMDVAGRREFWRAMRDYAASGKTIVFATHYLDEVEENASRVVVMARGMVVADGTPAEIRSVGGSSLVRFRLPEQASVSGLAALPGRVTADGGWVSLRTDDPDAAVRTLAASTLPWSDLQVSPRDLDDSFLTLTATGEDGEAGSLELTAATEAAR